MTIEKTHIPEVHILTRGGFSDFRGGFSRMLDVAELKTAGLYADFVQVNLSHNYKKGTLRGLHSQISTAAEDKLVSCIRGEIFDVCVDVRPDSATYGQYVGEVLSEKNGKMLYVPKGFAHGYLGLTDDSLTLYFVSQYYTPGSEKGYRYDDPFFGIEWPIKPPYIITDKDASWPLVRVQSQ